MLTSPRRFRASAAVRTLFLTLGAVLLGAGAGPAAGQCTLVSGPNQITAPSQWEGSYYGLVIWPKAIPRPYQAGGQDRLLIQLNYGHAVYSLANPANPSFLGLGDVRNEPVGPITKDGQSFVSGVAASGDGQRALVSMDVTGYGSTLVGSPNPDAFEPRGDAGNFRSINGLVIQKTAGGRYIGYGLTSTGRLWASDITNLPSSFTVGNMNSEQGFSAYTGGGSNYLQLAEGNGRQYLYWLNSVPSGATVVVADVRNPGPSGAITAAYPVWTIPYSDWGQPAADVLSYVSAAVDPQSASGNVYLLGLFKSASGTNYFALRSFSPITGQSASAGTFVPAPPFGQYAGGRAALAVPNTFSNDVDIYMWTSTSSAPTGTLRLYATSAKYFGSTIGQTVDLDKTSPGNPKSIADMAVLRKSSTDVYAYLTDGIGGVTPYAVQMSCQAGPSAAVGRLAVANVSGGPPVQLTSGATVFVGDTLQVTPSVTPPSAIWPISRWNLDLDYHDPAEKGSGSPPYYTQLLNPDACLIGCWNPFSSDPDPPPFTLVGPCDRNFASANPATGASCWSSVVTGGDFTSSPAAGATATLPIAFEAANALNTSTVPLATFNVVWKVPTVQVQSLSALLNSGLASFQAADASVIGHPVSYKWYFGSNPAAPSSETLTQDTTCVGPACTHTFPAGKGTYNAWLTASYKNGYVSPECGPPCTFPRAGSFTVNVTDFVAAFTAPSTAYIGGNQMTVTNQSQAGGGVTVNKYSYSLCDATSGPCPEGTYSDLLLNGPWSIDVPPTAGTWWLRIKATYNITSVAQWKPNVVSGHPEAWPITVSTQPPTLKPTGSPGVDGWSFCTVGCGSIAYAGSVGTQLTVGVFQGLDQQSGSFNWQSSGVSTTPGSATGPTFTFNPTTSGTLTVTETTFNITVRIAIAGPAQPPSGPSVSVNATPGSPALGETVNFTASASGGSGTYTNYFWNFGDGQTAASQFRSATHAYSTAGSYAARCTVTDSQGHQGSGATTVLVGGGGGGGGSLAVSVTASPSTAAPGVSIAFSASASGGSGTYTNYFWNFGDGQVAASAYSGASHAFSLPGSYVTNCTVTDSQGNSVMGQVPVTIGAASAPSDFRIGYPGGKDAVPGSDGSFLVVIGQQVTFRTVDPGSGKTILQPASWNWGDGTTSGTNPAVKMWMTGGTYPVTLIVAGQAPVVHNVNVVGGIPTGDYTVVYSLNGNPGGPVDPGNVAPGKGIHFSASGPPGSSYYWNFGDGTDCLTDPASPCASVTSHAFANPGSYSVVLTVTLGGNSFSTKTPTTFNVVDQRWIVPGLAYTSGLVPGSFYVSDVVIQNTSADQWAAYSAALLDGSNPPNWKTLAAFEPGESRRIPNVLQSVFGKASGGPTYAMVIRGDSVPVGGDPAIWAFTYNNNAGDPLKGTYGVAIPGVPVSMAARPGSLAADREFPGLRDVPLTALPNISAAYTNIGFVNAGDVPATVNVSFYTRGADGPVALGNTFPLTVDPNQTRQVTQSLRQALAGTPQSYDTTVADNYFMAFDVVGDGARVVPYASVKDVSSTDSIFLTAVPNVSAAQIRVPSIVHVNSSSGDRFRSRVVLFNPSALDRAVKLTYSYRRCPAGGACEDRAEQTITSLNLPSGGTIMADDFVKAWFGDGLDETDNYIQSYLDVEPADANTDPLIVRGETYNSQSIGNFGTQVPGLLQSVHGATAGGAKTRLLIPYVVPRSGGSGYRTNVAFVALGDAPAQATVRLHEPTLDSGLPPAQEEVVTVDDKFLQLSLEKLFPELASFPHNPGGYYSVEIEVTSGTLAAYAVVNDNVTSDGSLIVAKPLPPPPQQP